MNQIKINTAEKELYYDGNVIVQYTIEYPEMLDYSNENVTRKFNHYYRERAKALKDYAEGELYKQAVEVYIYNKANNYPIMVFQLITNCNITCQNSQLISLYTDEYVFTGGAHGSTIRNSQTWDLKTGYLIPLCNLYKECNTKCECEFLLKILREINRQIQKQLEQYPSIYFENYCQLVLETICLESYYISNEGIMVYFQQYDIAPYSTGLPTFKVC